MSSIPLENTRLPVRKLSSKSPPESLPRDLALDAYKDARQIVRLAQCPQCSDLFQLPVTLPCGNSLCRKCMPGSNGTGAFKCPFSSCRQEHAEVDGKVDVVLNKIMNTVDKEMHKYADQAEASNVLIRVEEHTRRSIVGVTPRDSNPQSEVLPGGRLVATYMMAKMGKLAHDSEAIYTELSSDADSMNSDFDAAALDHGLTELLKRSIRPELDCHVCYGLLLDPLTTLCGHTFCRQCVRRILDYSNYCPMCRRALGIPMDIQAMLTPSNATLNKMINGLCTDAATLRRSEKPTAGIGELDTPLFICTISFPSMPTFLYIFEPRYKLMIRRAMESGDRTFGMLLTNSECTPQGDLGPVHFYQYGTLLYIRDLKALADGSGRLLIETVGLSRFRVVRHGLLDGYAVGKIERFDDMSLDAEEALETMEITQSPSQFDTRTSAGEDHSVSEQTYNQSPTQDQNVEGARGERTRRSSLRPRRSPTERRASPPSSETSEAAAKLLSKLTTEELVTFCRKFIDRMTSISAPWLHRNILDAYGPCPDDSADVPWWLGTIIPVSDIKKQKLLEADSVRERLKMCAGWIVEVETRNSCRSSSTNCTVV